MSKSVKNAMLLACQHLLLPVVRLLLHAGVTYREFAEISKRAYVEVASEEFGLQGRKTNISRVAILTGIGRKEVRRLRTEIVADQDPFSSTMNPATRVMSAWHQEPGYQDGGGRPRALPGAELEALIEAHSGDIPASAILKELQRVAAVEQLADGTYQARARSFIPGKLNPDSVRMLGAHVHDLGATIAANLLNTSNPRFQRVVSNENLDGRTLSRFHRLISQKGETMLESLDDWLTANAADTATASGKRHRAGIGIYFFTNPIEQDAST